MQGPEIITNKLDAAGITYCLVGGLASIAYGRPRLTLDADLLIALHLEKLDALFQAFSSEDFYLPPREILEAEIQRESRGHFNIIHQHSALRADCYLPGKSELALWELKNRRQLPALPDSEVWFAPPESVIVHKLLFYREGQSPKHLEDIRAILTSHTKLDQFELTRWINKLHLQAEWQEANPPND